MKKRGKITKHQLDVYNVISYSWKMKRRIPTLQEIATELGKNSTGTIHKHLKNLIALGWIKEGKEGKEKYFPFWAKNPSLEDVDDLVPLLGVIAAGKPIEAVEEGARISIPSEMKTPGTYVLKVQGDSMCEEGVFDGDFIICERRERYEPGAMVVARIDQDKVTLKRVYQEAGGLIRLQPSNSKLPPLVVEEDELEIDGQVKGVIRKF